MGGSNGRRGGRKTISGYETIKRKGADSRGKKESESLSRVRLFATPWNIVHQAPPSMGFSRQEYWSAFPLPSPGDLPDPGIEPRSPALQADALPSEPSGVAEEEGSYSERGIRESVFVVPSKVRLE